MASKAELILGKATAHIGVARYAADIEVGRHRLVADEPKALGACTAATLKMYAERTPVTLAIKGGVAIHTEIEEGETARLT